MYKITKYVSFDGREFDDQAKCMDHEYTIESITILMAKLPIIPDDCNFSNGGGYIKHNKLDFMFVRKELLELAKNYSDHRWIQDAIDEGLEIHPSYPNRIISDCCPKLLVEAWHRIYCTDKKFREWGQPYYAENPEQAEQKCLND